jgi:hypothetical protein
MTKDHLARDPSSWQASDGPSDEVPIEVVLHPAILAHGQVRSRADTVRVPEDSGESIVVRWSLNPR